tara:strand:+ start:3328 stop:3645 length:318 start_codon:yes stop_codon:yes gene_type:complete
MNDLDIPQDVNLYERYTELAKEDEEAAACLQAVHETFEHFEIRPESYKEVGNILLRFSHFMGEQDEGLQIGEDDTMNFVADLYEYYEQRATAILEAPQLKVHKAP